MLPYQIDFQQPQWLVLLLALPAAWWLGRKSLAGLGRTRRLAALLLRSAVAVALVLALAEVQLVRTSDRLAVMYLVDRSASIAADEAQRALNFVNDSRARGIDTRRDDLAGMITFGREAAIELPLSSQASPLARTEAVVDPESTNLASALNLAAACFPPDSAKRVVILSDGNENLGEAAVAARALADAGVGIDVLPLATRRESDVIVDKVMAPNEAQRDAPFEVRVVLENVAPGSSAPRPVSGRLHVVRRQGDDEQLLAEQPITLEPGKHVYNLRDQLPAPDFYTYEVRFIADDAADDAVAQNNRASAFTQVRGAGRVLLIEDGQRRGEFGFLVERLRAANLEVSVQPTDLLFTRLADLQRYDTVVLADVPRTGGDEADVFSFTDEQLELLVRNTQQLGGGLVMLGGPNSFGAGGWADTPLEEALPVYCRVQSAKVVPSGALMLVIDNSGSMSGEKIEMSKAAAIAAMKTLGPRDWLGVVSFDAAAKRIVPLQRVGSGQVPARLIGRLGIGGGTNMRPGLEEGYGQLGKIQAAIKHVIVLTDGQTVGGGYPEMAASMRARGITTTCVAVGTDAAGGMLSEVARAGGGKFYQFVHPKAIPRIFMKEAVRVARPLVYEDPRGLEPQVDFPHEILKGTSGIPPVTGFVMTSTKQNPLVEVLLSSPRPTDERHPLLATWTFGLGRSVALTTDAGQRWATAWRTWPGYDKLFLQMIRWSMRPQGDNGAFTIAADVRDRKLRVVVSALERTAGQVNLLAMTGSVVGPGMQPSDLTIEQVAPGMYAGEFPAERPGTYFVTVLPGGRFSPLRAGVSVTGGEEFRRLESNDSLLDSLAALAPRGGMPGKVLATAPGPIAEQPSVFRRDLAGSSGRRSAWPAMLFWAAFLFLADITNRRLDVAAMLAAPVKALAAAYRRRRATASAATPVLERLRHRKNEIDQQLADRRASARFEPQAETASDALPNVSGSPVNKSAATETSTPKAPTEEESYTARLLEAKQRVWRDRK